MDRPTVSPGASPQLPRAIPLDEWVLAHGPLWPFAALVMVLNTCALASRLTVAELGHAIESLNTSNIIRDEQGGWSWVPVTADSAAHAVSDDEVIERLGVILLHCLSGQAPVYPFPVEQALRKELRSLSPELPTGVADLTVEAVTARRRAGLTLAAFAGDVRQALGAERQSDTRRSRRQKRLLVTATTLLVVSLGSTWWLTRRGGERVEAYGLTTGETALLDVASETAQTFALIDEHTAGIQEYQQIARLWGARVAPADPRLAWNEAHEAWIRTLAGDRLTTEQLLEGKPAWLGAQVGDRHPYTRAARLELADTLSARAATVEASTLRGQAEQLTRDLLQGTGLASTLLDQTPAPPGVLAHVAPNAAEREGFRHGRDASFFAPLTSTQRWMAGREGWRLHVVAVGACRTSLIAGTVPRLIAVKITPSADHGWNAQVEGVKPIVRWHGIAAEKLGVSLSADRTEAVTTLFGDGSAHASHIDPATNVPDPPYSLTFDGGPDGSGCAIVWLEIPFPTAPKSPAPLSSQNPRQ
jgi:hypothetical protein